MAKRGVAPQPTQLKLLRGNPGRRPLNAAEPKPRRTRPKMPDWLDDEAKSKWRALAPELFGLGLLTIVDGDALAAYCQACAEFKIATETLRTEGRTFRTDNGYIVPHPAAVQQARATKTIKEFSAHFGLDPSGRSKLTPPPADEAEDEFEQFLAGKKA
jgi:P27 family predicted phage terminase small subunit